VGSSLAAVSKRRAPSGNTRGRRPAPWWGDGPPPHERWPGVTIKIPAVWSAKNKRWESPDGRYYFDAAAADKACDFFPTFLTHHIGEFAGQSFDLLDYQRLLIVRPVFGWKRTSDGTRRFRYVFLFVPKGNGKSPLGSGLGLFLALCDDEAGAEVYAVAGDKDQAKVVHESAKVMVEQSADLMELCEVLKDSIYQPQSRSFYKVLSSDAAGKHGRRPHGVIFDELHNQRNRDLYEALRKSLLKRRQPLLFMLTHAGDDDETICYEEYEAAKRVLSGTSRDEAFLPVVFEAGDKEDWSKPKVWKKTNPGFGLTINPGMFAAECQAAQDEPRKRNDFLRFNLNRWVGTAVSWVPVEWWDACQKPIDEQQLVTLACAGGLDMAQKIDLASFVAAFRQPLEEAIKVEVVAENEAGQEERHELSLNYRVYVRPFFWLPEATVRDREREGFTLYRTWEEAGLLTVTEGASIDYDRVYKDIVKIAERYPLLKQGEIGYDPAFATDIAARLRDKAGLKTVEVLQNYSHMNEPCHVFEALVKAGRVVHDGHKVLRWNVENVAVKRDDAGRVRPVKPRRATKKIDGVVATLMGLSRLMAVPEPPTPQDYAVEWIG
jgi:phage terminase large subunit-like protein